MSYAAFHSIDLPEYRVLLKRLRERIGCDIYRNRIDYGKKLSSLIIFCEKDLLLYDCIASY